MIREYQMFFLYNLILIIALGKGNLLPPAIARETSQNNQVGYFTYST